ncbi:MAG: hypothetical protein D6753_11115 [Planctomycetota bacterium]|nr:MAG: hypothetical protein D6753_11115 [Planctomycetota bacterium]
MLSYLVVLALEATRPFCKVPFRNWLSAGMLTAGIIAHGTFLYYQFAQSLNGSGHLFADWFQWVQVGSFVLAIVCLVLLLRNPNTGVSLFLVPIILLLSVLGLLFREAGSFSIAPGQQVALWRWVHTLSLLIGTVLIGLGAAFGGMYLVQADRLKRKVGGLRKLKLPPLEFQQSVNRLCLLATPVFLGVGMVSGILLKLSESDSVPWFDGGIAATAILFLWSLLAAGWEFLSSGSLGGRRSARLAIANFLFMMMVLLALVLSSHGLAGQGEESSPMQSPAEVSS